MAKPKKPNPKLYLSERSDLYFQRRYRRGTIPILLIGAVGAAAFARYNVHVGHGGMYYAVAAMLLGIAVWQFFYTRTAKVACEEVDGRCRFLQQETNFESRALNATDMDIDDFDSSDKVLLTGYTNLPIKKNAPLYRADSADKVGRSSHLQMSYFVLGPDSVEAFSLVRSLLSPDETQENTSWHYDRIGQITLDEVSLACPTSPGGAETENRKFPVIIIRGDNKRVRRTYAFMPDQIGRARDLVASIERKINMT